MAPRLLLASLLLALVGTVSAAHAEPVSPSVDAARTAPSLTPGAPTLLAPPPVPNAPPTLLVPSPMAEPSAPAPAAPPVAPLALRLTLQPTTAATDTAAPAAPVSQAADSKRMWTALGGTTFLAGYAVPAFIGLALGMTSLVGGAMGDGGHVTYHGSSASPALLFIPVAGPMAYYATTTDGSPAWYAISTGVQVAGLATMIYGLTRPAAKQTASWRVTPVVAPGGGAATVSGSF